MGVVAADDDEDEVNGVTEKDEDSPLPELPDTGLPFGSSPGSMVGWDFRELHQHVGSQQQFQGENESQVEMPIGGFVEKYLQTAEPEEPEQPEVFESVPEVPQEPEVFESVPEVPPEWEIPMEEIPEIEVPQIETPEVVEEVEETGEMSETEKKKLAQLEKKRATSRAWHAKFVSAGVERKSKKQKTDKEEDKTGVEKPASFSSLTKAKDWFVKDWIARSDMPQSVERRTRSIEAWMASRLRADFLAGRSGIQK